MDVFLFLNGDFETHGTPMRVSSGTSLQEFLQNAGDTLEITALGINLVRAFTGAGTELFSLEGVRSGDRVYLSAGENFLFNEAIYQEEAPAPVQRPNNGIPVASAAAAAAVPSMYAQNAPSMNQGAYQQAVDVHDPNYRPGPLENAASNAATFIQYAYGLASNILMFTHPRIGVTMNQVKDAVHNNYSENIAYHEQQMKQKLRKADVAVERVVNKLQERKTVYLQSLNGQTLQKTLDEVSGAIKNTVNAAATNFNSSKNGIPEGMTAEEFYAHAQAAYGSNGTGDIESFVGRLAAKAGLLWHDKLQPQAEHLYRHFKEVKGGLQVATAAVTARIAGTPAATSPYAVPPPVQDHPVDSSPQNIPVAHAAQQQYRAAGPYGASRAVYAGGNPVQQQPRQTTVEIIEEPKNSSPHHGDTPHHSDHMLD